MNRNQNGSFEDKYSGFFDAYDPERLEQREAIKRNIEMQNAERRAKLARRAKLRRKAYIRRVGALLVVAAIIVGIVLGIKGCVSASEDKESPSSQIASSKTEVAATPPAPELFVPDFTDNTHLMSDEIYSSNAILVNADTGEVAAAKGSNDHIRPASLVKVMTALVAADHLTDRNRKYTFTHDLLNPLYNSDLIMIGYDEGEVATVDELFHGALMFSGADSTMALVDMVSESVEEFAALMNEKATELGLKNTHFDNPVGEDSEELYSTCYDMAIIMQAAISNDYLREVLSVEDYLLPANERHPDGIPLKNQMFAKMHGTEPEVAIIKGGKTGFTGKAGFCLISYAEGNDGSTWIAVTVNANGSYRPVYDAFELYKNHTGLTKPE